MAAHAAPRPTGAPAREVAPHHRTQLITPSRERQRPGLRLPVDEWRLVSAAGTVVAAAAALVVIALVALVVVSTNAREPEPPSTHDVVQDS